MSQWVIRGLRTGVKSTRYPWVEETAPGTSPGMPVSTMLAPDLARALVAHCPVDALRLSTTGIDVSMRKCIHCFRCVRATDSPMDWMGGYEWATAATARDVNATNFGAVFGRSMHIFVVDSGDCGACLNEIKQLNNPYYNMHRLGFFLTPTPRHADVLLVVGALTDHMRLPLRKAYDAMPTPKRVVAAGACALSGGIFGQSFMCAGGVGEFLPVDVEVPGNPPPPLAILHGLLVAVGRKPPAGPHEWPDGQAEHGLR